jgi:hypothetical protein
LRRKVRALLTYLAVTARLHRRITLAALFCPEAADPSAALRLLLARIRSQLGPAVLTAGDRMVALNLSDIHVDVLASEHVLTNGVYSAAVDLYRSRFCEGFDLAAAPGCKL